MKFQILAVFLQPLGSGVKFIAYLLLAGTPSAVVSLLHREVARYLRTPDAKERLLKAGIEAVGNTPEEFAAIMREDITHKGKIIREAGIRME